MSETVSRLPFRLFVLVVSGLGLLVFCFGMAGWESREPLKGYFFLLMALIASGMRLNLPRIMGTMSLNFVFVLIGLTELSLSETMLMACAATAVQVLAHSQVRRAPVSPLFHVASMSMAVYLTHRVYTAEYIRHFNVSWFGALILASLVLFVMNTFPVAVVMALSEQRKLTGMWRECNFWTFPYYLAGASLAGLYHVSEDLLGDRATLFLLPLAFAIYCSYQLYLGRLSREKTRVEALAALHQRTIEALAMAIEAKDVTQQIHLRRVQLYCSEIGAELKLPEDQLEALRAAAVLHDVGKLAVPEHILSKPARLTREEFEKVKIHPRVGAEILERVNFPYPVAGIVRSHHEKWNGGGYPDGLKGEAIPMGARILSVVDALDALISDRPYRAALSLTEAIDRLSAESGVSYDPKVVHVVQRRYAELEKRLAAEDSKPELPSPRARLEVRVAVPAGGDDVPTPEPTRPALDTNAAARQEAQVMLELEQQLGKSLQLDETLPALAIGLRRVVGFDSMVIHLVRDGLLVARYATGEGAGAFLSRQVEIGRGLCGWVALNKKPIINGNPSLELGLGDDHPTRMGMLSTAMVVPLASTEGTVGTLMICRRGFSGFDKDNLRILQALSTKLALVIQNAQKYEQVSASATTDFLTGLPNSRALHVQLDIELSRCRRLGGTLTVLVTDLDGFKLVNDRFGHLEGNEVLRAVGTALRQACREYDYVARMGGDEFVLLLPGLREEDAAAKVALLNQVVAEAGRSVCPESTLALSVGEAWFPVDGGEADALLAIADQRMYRAKTARKLRKHRDSPRGFDFDQIESKIP
jgi:diguanylate cyclase (GGDEF)-like protein/putative nucleotidyltransferase with HDIG domain